MSNASASEDQNWGTPWWLVVIWGIAAVIMGILLFMRPAATTIILVQFLGIYWLITGIFSIISLVWDRTAWGWKLFSGILGIIAGLLIIQNPLWSTLLVPTTLAWVLGFTGIFIGVIQLIQAFRGAGWGAGVLGALSILLGFLLIARPVIAGLALPWVLGGLLIAGGILAIIAAFGLRNEENQLETVESQGISRTYASEVPMTGTSTPTATPAVEVQSDSIRTAEIAAVGTAAVVASVAAAERPEDVGDEEIVEVAEEDGEEEVVGMAEVVIAEVTEVDFTGNVDPNNPVEMAKFKYSLEYVEGIGPVYAEQLKAIGLVSCLDLLKSGSSRKGRQQIAEQSGISSKLILKWVNHVDLYRIKGVGSEYADLLEASGVDTVVELAQRNPLNLNNQLLEINVGKNLVRKPPTLSQVEDWVSQAKDLPRVVTY